MERPRIPADMLTKFLSAESLSRHSKNVGCEFPVDNFQVLKVRDSLAACSELEVRFKNFAKHLGSARAPERWITSQPLFKEAQRQSCAMISANSQCFPVLCLFGLSDGATSVRGGVTDSFVHDNCFLREPVGVPNPIGDNRKE